MGTLSIHDRTLRELTQKLNEFYKHNSAWQVLTNVLWAPFSEFPGNKFNFDLILIHNAPYTITPKHDVELHDCHHVVTVIDIVNENYEAEFYDKPDLLLFSSAQEYVLFDPEAKYLRPRLHGARKCNGVFQHRKSCQDGIFFSVAEFSLNFNAEEITLTPCHFARNHEELFKLRKTYNRQPSAELAKKIEELQYKIEQIESEDA